MGDLVQGRLATNFRNFLNLAKIVFFYFALSYLFPCWTTTMATPQPLVSLTSDSSEFQLMKQSVGIMDLFRNNGAVAAVGKSILNESLRRIMFTVQRRKREKPNGWNSSTNIHGTNLRNKGVTSQVDSLAPHDDSSSTADEFNKTNVYILLAEQEAKCLEEFGKLEPAITFEFPQDLFRPFVCLEGSQNFTKCEQCVQMIREIHVDYAANQAPSCQSICRPSFALPKCAERCTEFVQKLMNGTESLSPRPVADNHKPNAASRCQLNECSLKFPASEVHNSREEATSVADKNSNDTLTANVFCESVTQPWSKSYVSIYSVLTTSFERQYANLRHFVYLKSFFGRGGDRTGGSTDVPVVFVVEQREFNMNISGPKLDLRRKWTGWTTLGKSPYGLHKIEVGYRQHTYQWRVTAVGNSGPLAVSIIKSYKTLDGYMEPGPPGRVFVIENKPKGSTVDVLLGWTPPKERACFYKIVLETRNEEEFVRTVRIKGEPSGVHKVWFYRLKFDSTYEVRITSRGAEWHEDESTQTSLSFKTPACLVARQFRFDKCAPPSPRNLSYKVETMTSSTMMTEVPENRTSSSKRFFTAHLVWQPPAFTSETNLIQEYVVDIRAFSLNIRNISKKDSEYTASRSKLIEPQRVFDHIRINLPGNVTHAKVDNLDETVEYTVLVSAVSSKGSSSPATLAIKMDSAIGSKDTTLWFWVYLCGALNAVLLTASVCSTVKIIRKRRKIKAARDSYFTNIDRRDTYARDWSVVSLTEEPISSTRKVHEENSFDREEWHVSLQDLTIGDIVGKGQFGIVREAKIRRDTYMELLKRHSRNTLGTKYQTLDYEFGDEDTGMETVALKMLRVFATKTEGEDLMKELMTMQNLGTHPQIVTLLGVCRTPKSMCFVLEYCPGGDLLSFLRKFQEKYLPLLNLKSGNVEEVNFESAEDKSLSHGNNFLRKNPTAIGDDSDEFQQVCYADIHHNEISSPELSDEIQACAREAEADTPGGTGEGTLECKSISEKDALSYARQIALGMAYLERNHIIHRDLACRNILVMADHKHVKISDFGLSRDIYTRNVYHQKTEGKLPFKWMALESISSRIFTSKSDVWSYGIVLWEIVTLGAVPYPVVENKQLFNKLRTGYRMERPDNCSEELYALMRKCWRTVPADRPNFTELTLYLEAMMRNEPGLYLTLQP